MLLRHNNSMNGIDPVSYHMHNSHNSHISHKRVKQVVAPNNELSISFKYFFFTFASYIYNTQSVYEEPISLNCCWINESKYNA